MTVEYPELSSSVTAVGGVVLLFGVLALLVLIYCSRGERADGSADFWGLHVTVKEIDRRYRVNWAPGGFWPSPEAHSTQTSSLYSIVWGFLVWWLLETSVFLIICGMSSSIEVYRGDRHLVASVLIVIALVLCGIWMLVFRLGSLSDKQREERKAKVIQAQERQDANAFFDVSQYEKKSFFEIAFGLLVVAFFLALGAVWHLRAWTLPGPQYGTLIFVAPGYGLFAGWVFYAATLNFGIVYCADSCPDNVRPRPEGVSDYVYRASLWPVFFAIVIGIFALAVPDPTLPLPMAVAVGLFTPRHSQHICAVAILVVLMGAAVGLVFVAR